MGNLGRISPPKAALFDNNWTLFFFFGAIATQPATSLPPSAQATYHVASDGQGAEPNTDQQHSPQLPRHANAPPIGRGGACPNEPHEGHGAARTHPLLRKQPVGMPSCKLRRPMPRISPRSRHTLLPRDNTLRKRGTTEAAGPTHGGRGTGSVAEKCILIFAGMAVMALNEIDRPPLPPHAVRNDRADAAVHVSQAPLFRHAAEDLSPTLGPKGARHDL